MNEEVDHAVEIMNELGKEVVETIVTDLSENIVALSFKIEGEEYPPKLEATFVEETDKNYDVKHTVEREIRYKDLEGIGKQESLNEAVARAMQKDHDNGQNN